MPVTARLSRKFYEAFGDEIVNELVEWFNQLDTTYRSELRELNELNFARFDAKLEQRVAELRSEMEAGFAALRVEMASLKSDLVRWMFIFWTGTMVTLLGTVIALVKL